MLRYANGSLWKNLVKILQISGNLLLEDNTSTLDHLFSFLHGTDIYFVCVFLEADPSQFPFQVRKAQVFQPISFYLPIFIPAGCIASVPLYHGPRCHSASLFLSNPVPSELCRGSGGGRLVSPRHTARDWQ